MARNTENLMVVAHGERAGTASALQMPSVAGRFVRIKAKGDNATNVYIGTSDAVTVPAETTDLTSGYPLDAGQEIELPLAANLNELYYICDAVGDSFSFIVLGNPGVQY